MGRQGAYTYVNVQECAQKEEQLAWNRGKECGEEKERGI